jgi:hypothetical protein
MAASTAFEVLSPGTSGLVSPAATCLELATPFQISDVNAFGPYV